MLKTIDINRDMLKRALEFSGREHLLHLKYSKLESWLKGEDNPTLRQLERFSKDTSTPFGYFFLKEPPARYLPIPHFRTMG